MYTINRDIALKLNPSEESLQKRKVASEKLVAERTENGKYGSNSTIAACNAPVTGYQPTAAGCGKFKDK